MSQIPSGCTTPSTSTSDASPIRAWHTTLPTTTAFDISRYLITITLSYRCDGLSNSITNTTRDTVSRLPRPPAKWLETSDTTPFLAIVLFGAEQSTAFNDCSLCSDEVCLLSMAVLFVTLRMALFAQIYGHRYVDFFNVVMICGIH